MKAFDLIYRFFESFVQLDDVGIVMFMLQIFFSIVILMPASILTTKKIFEVIRSE